MSRQQYAKLQAEQRAAFAEHVKANAEALKSRQNYATATDNAAVTARATYDKWAKLLGQQIDEGAKP